MQNIIDVFVSLYVHQALDEYICALIIWVWDKLEVNPEEGPRHGSVLCVVSLLKTLKDEIEGVKHLDSVDIRVSSIVDDSICYYKTLQRNLRFTCQVSF